jgi:hypothetical protein
MMSSPVPRQLTLPEFYQPRDTRAVPRSVRARVILWWMRRDAGSKAGRRSR